MERHFNIEGMTCAACVAAVERSVNKIEGIDEVEVNLLTKSMTVRAKDIDDKKIIAAIEKAGYKAQLKNDESKAEGTDNSQLESSDIYAKEKTDMKRRLIISAIFMIPLMYIAMGEMFGMPLPKFLSGHDRRLSNVFTQFLLSIPVLFVNKKYFTGGFKALLNRNPNMDSLIAVGSAASEFYGIIAIFMMIYGLEKNMPQIYDRYAHDIYFESAAMILTLITLGKYFEANSKSKTSKAITSLMDLQPKIATIIKDDMELQIPVKELKIGDIILIKPGESIPVDGIIIEGNSAVDQSALTGESIPVEKTVGDEVMSGTINKFGSFKFEAKKVGSDTAIAKIIKLVQDASSSKAPIAKLADKIAGVFVPIVMVISLITFLYWNFHIKDLELALNMAISVLVISCPCALGLATPVAIMVSTGVGAKNGILIKSAEALETLHDIDTVIFDKTGTLTKGKPFVTDLINFDIDKRKLLDIAYTLEKPSEHPLSKAIIEYANENNAKDYKVSDFEALSGLGIRGKIDEKVYIAGNKVFIEQNGLDSKNISKEIEKLAMEGKTPLIFANEEKILGIIAVSDVLKENSKAAIESLNKMGIDTFMITGDNKQTATAIAQKLNLKHFIADVMPEDKDKAVRDLMEKGKVVAMVGDGINDAPALMRSDVGIAIGAGTDVAIESADIVLMKNDLTDVLNAINLSKKTIKNIKQNLFWAFFYNTLGIPIAAGLLYESMGLKLSPMIGALAMSLSSLFVVTNALRLNGFKFTKGKYEESDDLSKINQDKEEEKLMEKKIVIDGMTCGHCKKRVEEALNKIDGVLATVDLENKCANLELKKAVSDEVLKSTVEDAGYDVLEIK
ncbi:MAG: heavy metal translocating P-type ATPase [Tissierellia bacterium]|nr:heavy metal translocating P-type ATPase [Tissierellia bacterium]